MKKSIALLLFLVILPAALGESDKIFTSDHVVLDFNISSAVNVQPQSDYYSLNYVNAELVYFPQDDERQSVVSQDYSPNAERVNDTLRFRWENVKSNALKFRVNSRLNILNRQNYIPQKVDFPLADVPKEVEEYTRPTAIIDSDNPKIIRLASSLAQGETDLFAVAFKLGNWTKNNVAYDLNSQTANITQKASWVLDNREGVCDELTSLFIAMLRSLNVPARFVAGYAYTNSLLFTERWGSHGWAEVYFPGYGWVPFDVTYGELGYIDASHIKLITTADPNMSSTVYSWEGRNVALETEPLQFATKVVEVGPEIKDKIRLSASVLHNNVGFGSYNLVEATVENPTLFYIAEDIHISKTESTQLMDSNDKLVLLRPGQKKLLHWILKVDSGLDSRYFYTFPITVYTTSNITTNTNFKSQKAESQYTLAEMQSYVNDRAGDEQKVYTDSINLSCSTDKNTYHIYETIKVTCSLKNTGNTLLQGLQVCLKNNCTALDLALTRAATVSFDYRPESTKDNILTITAKNSKVSRSASLNPTILDVPAVQFTGINYPKNVTYKDNFNITFDIEKTSAASPKNIEIYLHGSGIEQRWQFSELASKKSFVIGMAASSLSAGANVLYIDVKFYDNNNREYTTTQQLEIYLATPTLWQRIMMFFSRIF